MQTIEIAGRDWTLSDNELGSGSYGVVYPATSGHDEAAIKIIPRDAQAGRELLFADDLRGIRGVVPVLGYATTEDDWFLLMPRAEKSLADDIARHAPFTQDVAVDILLSLAETLSELAARRVVHHDLKPANVLFLNGKWRLSDFGIARYLEAATDRDTFKFSTTRPYMAPEQWREEETKGASDIYAFGILAHELLTGRQPFNGPKYRDQHLHQEPPPLPTSSPLLAHLISDCLAKVAEARPSAAELVRILGNILSGPSASPSFQLLHEAGRRDAALQDEVRREASRRRTAEEKRAELTKVALTQFERISQTVRATILAGSHGIESSTPARDPGGWSLRIGAASLVMSGAVAVPAESFGRPRDAEYWKSEMGQVAQLPFDVVAQATISVRIYYDGLSWRFSRQHTLWYCDLRGDDRYSWQEIGFASPEYSVNVYSLSTVDRAARRTDLDNIVWPAKTIEIDDFTQRWADWFGQAVPNSALRSGQAAADGTLATRSRWFYWYAAFGWLAMIVGLFAAYKGASAVRSVSINNDASWFPPAGWLLAGYGLGILSGKITPHGRRLRAVQVVIGSLTSLGGILGVVCLVLGVFSNLFVLQK